MRVLAFGDLHAHTHRAFAGYSRGVNSRLQDAVSVMEQITEIAGDCEVAFFLGDLFHVSPPPSIVFNLMYDQFQKLASCCPVWMIAGNHDVHSRYYKRLEDVPFLKFTTIDNVGLLETLTPTPRSVAGESGAPVTVLGLNHRRLGDAREILAQSEGADLCLLHQDVFGASVGKYTFSEGVEAKDVSKYRWVLSGHIHEPQRVSDHFIVLGSPLHINFSDQGDRGVWVIDTEKDAAEMISLRFPRFITVGADSEKLSDGNFYRVQESSEKREEALKLPGVEEAVDEYVEALAPDAPEECGRVGRDLVSKVEQELPVPSGRRLARVEIENFTVFERGEFTVQPGLNLVVGEFEGGEGRSNGSGKSSLFEAVCWCLYGLTSKGERGLAVMRRGAERGRACRVKVEFDGDPLTVERTQSRSGTNLIATVADRVFEGRVPDVQRELVGLLGVSYEFFRQMVYYSQESVEFFSGMGDADRKRLLGTLLGLSWYDEACAAAKEKRDGARDLVMMCESEIKSLTAALEQAQKDVQATESRVADWEAAREKRVESLQLELNEREAARSRLTGDYDAERASQESVHQQKLEGIAEEAGRRRAAVETEFTEARRSLERETAREATLQQRVKAQTERVRSFPDEKALKADLASAEARVGEMRGELAEITRAGTLAESSAKHTSERVKELDEKMASIRRLDRGVRCQTCGSLITEESCRACLQELQKTRDATAATLSEFQRQKQGFDEQATAAQAQLKEQESNVADLRSRLSLAGDAQRALENIQTELAHVTAHIVTQRESLTAQFQVRRDLVDLWEAQAVENEKEAFTSRLSHLEAEFCSKREALDREIESLQRQLKSVRSEECPLVSVLADQRNRRETIGSRLREEKEKLASAQRSLAVFEFWVKGFGREGIPGVLLKDFCRLFTLEMNEVLSEMGFGISVELTSHTTLKSGEVRDRLDYVIRTRTGESTYKLLSGGEKVRVDLTSMLVLNRIASRRYGLSEGLFGILVLDEVLSALDEEGCEVIFEVLNRFPVKSTYVISHDARFKALFNQILTVRRSGDTSVIA